MPAPIRPAIERLKPEDFLRLIEKSRRRRGHRRSRNARARGNRGLVAGLEAIPCKKIPHGSGTVEIPDTEAISKRYPTVCTSEWKWWQFTRRALTCTLLTPTADLKLE